MMHLMRDLRLVCVLVLLLLVNDDKFSSDASPLPLLPIPSGAQLKWQRREIIMFFHFGMNTFTDSEWGTGRESPSVFRPTALDTRQWMEAANAVGASLVILVAKHHDGFCLWPSKYTKHSVERSPWRGGKGDLVGEFVAAARANGLDVGLYLSPWDRHEKSYGNEEEYNNFYLGQLEELLTKYGTISEMWLDGAKGKNAKNMTYHFEEWIRTAKKLQPEINVFSDAGPDIRWVGDEQGFAGRTCWSPINRTMLRIGDETIVKYLNSGDPTGTDWVPPECDVSLRPNWFWHPTDHPKPLHHLLKIYYNSVGRNCVLLLNASPNTTGLVPASDLHSLKLLHSSLTSTFSANLASTCTTMTTKPHVKTPSFPPQNTLNTTTNTNSFWWALEKGGGNKEVWMELEWEQGLVGGFNVVRIEEAVWLGQRVERHEVWVDGRRVVGNGTSVGYRRLHRLGKVERGVRKVRFVFGKWRGVEGPLISGVGLHYDPLWDQQHDSH